MAALLRVIEAKCYMNVPQKILVFPAGMPEALRFREQAMFQGDVVVGASSRRFEPVAQAYSLWEWLPYVHEPAFPDAIGDLLRRCEIDAIYSPHGVVAARLVEIMPDIAPRVRLIKPAPIDDTERAYRAVREWADRIVEQNWFHDSCVSARRPLKSANLSGVLRLVDTIPGMTDHDKTAAVIHAMQHAPDGDVVEIGSWWGRSAALFVLLAHAHGSGAVLCVDPWASQSLPQGVDVLDRASAAADTEAALRIFETNLAPLAGRRLNYLRACSIDAAPRYRPGLEIETDTFGHTIYSGEIAILHIDGNHSEASAALDSRLWTPHVKPGGWIIFDDYVWAFGDGPKRAGDAFLDREHDRIALSFVVGTALFVQLLNH